MHKFINQQSIIRVGSICMIFGDEHGENNGLTCLSYNVYFESGEWWADVVHYFDEVKFKTILNGEEVFLDKAAYPVTMLMSIGDAELELEEIE